MAKVLINKKDSIIKNIIESRNKLMEWAKGLPKSDEYYDFVNKCIKEDRIDWLLETYDNYITEKKIGKKLYDNCFNYSPMLKLVEHNFILGSDDEMNKTYSFKTKEECYKQVELIKEEKDYDPLESGDYEILEIKEKKGTLADNYKWIVSKHENGYRFFIKADTIYEDNIEIAYSDFS